MLSCFSCGDAHQIIVLMLMCESQPGYLSVFRRPRGSQQRRRSAAEVDSIRKVAVATSGGGSQQQQTAAAVAGSNH